MKYKVLSIKNFAVVLLTTFYLLLSTPVIHAQEIGSAGIVSTIMSFLGLFLTNEPLQPTTPTDTASSPPVISAATTITSYRDLYREIGGKVGIPPRILEGVMLIESPEMYKKFDAAQIALYSQPGNILPNCSPNNCSAIGPMQMTIGIDDTGSSLCKICTENGCPNQWASYKDSAQKYGGYSHQPNYCNLRDNIYSAAAKLKTDSGAVSGANWTQEQVYRAATRYYGSCGNSYIHSFARIGFQGNTTYCGALWWYYSLE